MKSAFCEFDDATLIETYKSGERCIFDEIDRRYREKLTFFLLRKTSSREIAEELTQETLTRAYAALERLDNGAFLSGWLYRIAYRIFIDWLRKTSRANCSTVYEETEFAEDDSWRVGGAGALEQREIRRPDGGAFDMNEPQESAIRSEERANLWRIARDSLTRDEFQVLWHKYVDDFDDAQVARAMGKSSGAVRSCAHRARVKLAEKLKKTQ